MGLGFYDNEARCYVYDDGVFDGEWFIDEEGSVYILPIDGDEVVGPDDDVSEELMKLWKTDNLDVGYLDRLGLSSVPSSLKRFTPEDGYFTA